MRGQHFIMPITKTKAESNPDGVMNKTFESLTDEELSMCWGHPIKDEDVRLAAARLLSSRRSRFRIGG